MPQGGCRPVGLIGGGRSTVFVNFPGLQAGVIVRPVNVDQTIVTLHRKLDDRISVHDRIDARAGRQVANVGERRPGKDDRMTTSAVKRGYDDLLFVVGGGIDDRIDQRCCQVRHVGRGQEPAIKISGLPLPVEMLKPQLNGMLHFGGRGLGDHQLDRLRTQRLVKREVVRPRDDDHRVDATL